MEESHVHQTQDIPNPTTGAIEERSGSVSSVRSGHSYVKPQEQATAEPHSQRGVHQQRPESPVSSCLSMKSDRSKGGGIHFNDGHHSTDQRVHQQRPESPVSSCLSMKSDRSKGGGIHFKDGHHSTDQRLAEEGQTFPDYVSMRTTRLSTEHVPQYGWNLESSRLSTCSESSDVSPFPQNKETKEVTCNICSDNKAVKICLTCNLSFCEIDVRPHYNNPAMQRHKLEDVTGEVDDKRCLHYHKPLEYYCKTDRIEICSVCSQTTHRGHDLIFNQASGGGQCQNSAKLDVLPPPGWFKILPLKTGSVNLTWEPPKGLDGPKQYRIVWKCDEEQNSLKIKNKCQIEINELKLGRKYDFAVATEANNVKSVWLTQSYFTEIPAPKDLIVDHHTSNSVTIRWTKAPRTDQIQQHFVISYGIPEAEPNTIYSESCIRTLSDLQPNTEYNISVSTVLPDGEESEPVSKTISTKSCLMGLLSTAGLKGHYEHKLKLSSVLEINHNTISDEPLHTMQSLPGAFLKRLMIASVDARSVRCVTSEDKYIFALDSGDQIESKSNNVNAINPLDLTTALFLCSDSALQQEMVQKMAMCQFAVPLLLPNCDTKETTLMLWPMRELVKKFKPCTSSESFAEENIVASKIPLVSFVSLGKDSLGKYQILNKMLNNAFVHRDMDCDDASRKISDGLVEISWFLPCGNKTIDVFAKPVAVANLRGDIRSFDKQFSFLCNTSAAVYIFSDDYEASVSVVKGKNTKAQLFLVVDGQKPEFQNRYASHRFDNIKMIVKKQQHDHDFVKTVLSSVNNISDNNPNIVTIEGMADVARHHGILVDEDSEVCRKAKSLADEITRIITKDTVNFKEEHLPLQGIMRELSLIDKENRKAGYHDISSLKTREEELRKKRKCFKMTDTMECFISAILGSNTERSYFLKWMRIILDNLSRQNLLDLRAQYKDLCQKSPKEKEIAGLDQKIFACSLGLEHFLRELGQLYEFYNAEHPVTENCPQKSQIKKLPLTYAEMLMEGHPIELVDGDALDIPLKWITDVLTCLNSHVKSNSRIKVVTVLGVQGTGKSTLLNAMFGAQFAVSSGRCTRGAFMQLIKVDKELREEMKCDFVLIIDTEGLKAPELAEQNESHEHDNELATLVVGLSDITVINMMMEDFAEMKDMLQIVVCAFLGMREVVKKPKFHFVHQNIPLISPDGNIRERKKLLEQLDEMTVAAAKMENNHTITKFTDVMDYDLDTSCSYIPGLWYGLPPMAPVSLGYSEAVYEFKKKLIQDIQRCQKTEDVTDFLKLTKRLRDSMMVRKLRQDTEDQVRSKLQKSFKSKEVEHEANNIKSPQAYMLEKKILDFLSHHRNNQSAFSNATLKQAFENLWNKAVSDSEINFQELPMRDIPEEISATLKENASSQHNINCMVDEMTLETCARKRFVVESGGWWEKAGGLMKHRDPENHRKELQDFCDGIIKECNAFITETVEEEGDYSETHIQDLLKIIDKSIRQQKKLELSEETEIGLKLHICGIAATEFQKMHEDFVDKNNPQLLLQKWKKNYSEDVMDRFHGRDQCQKKARDFVKLCLQPAVMDYVTKRTAPDVVEEMLIDSGSEDFSQQGALQYSILKELLEKQDYKKYKEYIHNYERFLKTWLVDQLGGKLSNNPCLNRYEKKHLTEMVKMIRTAISNITLWHSPNTVRDVKSFFQSLCNELGEKLHFPKNALDSIMILDIEYKDQLADCITEKVLEMEKLLSAEFDNRNRVDIGKRLRHLLFRTPLLNRLLGCRRQCPFCKALCEAGEKDHTEHFSSAHRPQGLNGIRASKMLVIEICSFPGVKASTESLTRKGSMDRAKNTHHHKWNLTTGSNMEATDYWKYVMLKFNDKIAKDCGALPAKIPDSWKGLTYREALTSLEKTFMTKQLCQQSQLSSLTT